MEHACTKSLNNHIVPIQQSDYLPSLVLSTYFGVKRNVSYLLPFHVVLTWLTIYYDSKELFCFNKIAEQSMEAFNLICILVSGFFY